MNDVRIQSILKQVEELLARAGELPDEAEQAISQLLNLVEALCADHKQLSEEVERLRKQMDQKKKPKTTHQTDQEDNSDAPPNPKDDSDHSSEKQRRKREKNPSSGQDRRSFKALEIHEEIECPVDPVTLPPDAVRVKDESVDVQDIEIKPRNIRFQRHVYYSAETGEYFRGPLPGGYDVGDFGADLRALILSLKYCGNMSEPKIREFLENFKVQISAGSVSNILTNPAASFEPAYHEILVAGLSSTSYQQTDDTSARVAGQAWHTHILCNPFYTWYSTRSGKDRLSVLAMLQNQAEPRFRFNEKTLDLLRGELKIPNKWQQRVFLLIQEQGGDIEYDAASLERLLDGWFNGHCQPTRTCIEHAAAIIAYQQQPLVPVIEVLVCDDAGQFKLLTEHLALCWIHDGRHYSRLSPVVPQHADLLDTFSERYWDFYQALQDYRAGPSEDLAEKLRKEFDELFSTKTGYDALDNRIAKTAAKQEELLTVLSHPSVPLHNNASELGARVSARRRDVSLHSRSERGARSMDIFTTLVQTCKKLGQSAYSYFRAHLRHQQTAPSLALSIQQAAAIG